MCIYSLKHIVLKKERCFQIFLSPNNLILLPSGLALVCAFKNEFYLKYIHKEKRWAEGQISLKGEKLKIGKVLV